MAEVTEHELETARRLGAVLLEARHAVGLSLRDLEQLCGLAPASIFRMETAARIPTLRSLMALSSVLPVRIVIEGGDATAYLIDPAERVPLQSLPETLDAVKPTSLAL